MFAVLILLPLSFVVYYVWLFYANVRRYPKGPRPLPIVGNLLSINLRKLNEDFEHISKDYGEIFTVWLPKPYVVIMNYDNIKEAFAKKGDDFNGRSGLFPDTLFQSMHNGGIVFSQVSLSAQEFLNHMKSIKNKDEVDLRRPFTVFVANVINRTLFGYGYSYDNADRLMRVADTLAILFDEARSSKVVFLAQLMPSILAIPVLRKYLSSEDNASRQRRCEEGVTVLGWQP
ncbi:hypothetical protein OSTOST_21011 [Ostertagia ostertagi]